MHNRVFSNLHSALRFSVVVVVSILASMTAAVLAQAPKPKQAEPGTKSPWQRVLQGDAAERVTALEQLINDLEKKGRFDAAVAPAREVLKIRHLKQGDDHWETVNARIKAVTCADVANRPREIQSDLSTAIRGRQEAQELRQHAQYRDAEALYRKVRGITLKVLGDDHPYTAQSYNNLANNLIELGNYTEAETLTRSALTICLHSLGRNHPWTASCFTNLAGSLDHQGRHDKAESYHHDSIEIAQRVFGEDDPVTLAFRNNLATNLTYQGKFADSETLLEGLTRISVATAGKHHITTARYYHNLADNQYAQGRYARAELLVQQALAIRRHTLGEDDPLTISSYSTLATCLYLQGRYDDAEHLHRKVLAFHLRRLGVNPNDAARSYSNLAALLNGQRKFKGAEAMAQESLKIRDRVLGKNHPQVASSCHNLAFSLRGQGRYLEAISFDQRALRIRRLSLGQAHPDTAHSYNSLAEYLESQGNYTDSEKLHQEALEIFCHALAKDHPDVALGYLKLALNLTFQGKYDEAEARAIDATRNYETARTAVSFSGLDRAEFARQRSPLPLLTALLARRGRNQDAWQSWEAGLAHGLFDDLVVRRARRMSNDERRRYEDLVGRIDKLDNQISSLSGAKNQAQRLDELKGHRVSLQGELSLFEAFLLKKYGVAAGAVYSLDQIQAQLPDHAALVGWLDLPTMPGTADPKGNHWACVVRRTGTPQWVRIVGTGPKEAWTMNDEKLVDEVIRLLRTDLKTDVHEPLLDLAKQRLAPLEAALSARDSLPAVRHLIVLPSQEIDGIPVEAMLGERPAGSPRYRVSYAPSGSVFAWLRERDKEHQGAPMQPRRLLALGDPVPPPAEKPIAQAPAPPEHGVLLRHVEPGSSVERAGIRPNDVLLRYAGNKVSDFADLKKQMKAADPKPALVPVTIWRDGRTIDLLLPPIEPEKVCVEGPAAQSILDRREGDASLRRTRGVNFARLPSSLREVNAIALFFDQREIYVGSDASEQTLNSLRSKGRLLEYDVIHVAAHGEIDNLSPMNSRLLLSQDHLPDPLAATDLNETSIDGTLTAGEVMGTWKLNANLVTLSACRSGLGRPGGGEGFVGFAQAFFLAGTRSVLVSLWDVDDDATSLLMTRFYQNWLVKHLSKAEALDEAKRWLRELSGKDVELELKKLNGEEVKHKPNLVARGKTVPRYEHPHDWAGFILMGDPD